MEQGFQQQKFISQFWRLKGQGQCVSRVEILGRSPWLADSYLQTATFWQCPQLGLWVCPLTSTPVQLDKGHP